MIYKDKVSGSGFIRNVDILAQIVNSLEIAQAGTKSKLNIGKLFRALFLPSRYHFIVLTLALPWAVFRLSAMKFCFKTEACW